MCMVGWGVLDVKEWDNFDASISTIRGHGAAPASLFLLLEFPPIVFLEASSGGIAKMRALGKRGEGGPHATHPLTIQWPGNKSVGGVCL